MREKPTRRRVKMRDLFTALVYLLICLMLFGVLGLFEGPLS